MQEDLTSAERLKRSAMSERDELAEETQTLNREKNSAQEEKRRLETRLGDLEEEKVKIKGIVLCSGKSRAIISCRIYIY